jgi:hypothetical protein
VALDHVEPLRSQHAKGSGWGRFGLLHRVFVIVVALTPGRDETNALVCRRIRQL